MTTSYQLSLRLKELGVEQENGEYYYYDVDGTPICMHKACVITLKMDTLCRALTLGELVREFGDCQIAITKLLNFNSVTITSLHEPITKVSEISPEEAAGELLAETLKNQTT